MRIFKQTTTYSFPVTPGRHWVRLYFFPFAYQGFDPSKAVFSVTAGPYTLLSNSNISSTTSSSYGAASYLFKEYSINVTETTFTITFIPNKQESLPFAFINALEVVSVPSNLISDDASPLGVSSPTAIGIPFMGMETMHRVNVGGPLVSPLNDTKGLFRTWLSGERFLFSSAGVENISVASSSIAYAPLSSPIFAPPVVYSTALQMITPDTASPQSLNISWVFPVDADYIYVVRLHFCELQYGTGGKRTFNIYLQNQTAYSDLDLGEKVGQNVPFFVDFSLTISNDINLWVQAGPPPNSDSGIFNKAIVSGIEIWKLNDSQARLDGIGDNGKTSSQSHGKSKAGEIVGGVVGTMAALGFVFMGIHYLRKRKAEMIKHSSSAWSPLPVHSGHSTSVARKSTLSGTGSYVSSPPSSLGRAFSFAEMMDATRGFAETLVVGMGGFGKVYKGELDDGTKVAVKRGNPQSQQGMLEFQTEIEMLSKLRHRHLVSLVGYCKDNQEMILVYEYMANGSLRSHLYGCNLPPLSWRHRLEICIGAARGLHYLHTGVAQCIIHRDVKTTNILLDQHLVAKVSDFGLSKTGPSLDQTHVSTAVKGSFGYLDPEYFRRQQLTQKSDVYSFGVVLMEVLCARPALNPTLPRDQVNIAEYAVYWQSMGRLDEIIDPFLAGSIKATSLAKFGETAEKCLADEGIHRPAIGEVLWNLEYALQLQDTPAATHHASVNSEDQMLELPMLHPVHDHGEESIAIDHSIAGSDVDATISVVFSRLVRPQGR